MERRNKVIHKLLILCCLKGAKLLQDYRPTEDYISIYENVIELCTVNMSGNEIILCSSYVSIAASYFQTKNYS